MKLFSREYSPHARKMIEVRGSLMRIESIKNVSMHLEDEFHEAANAMTLNIDL